MLFSELDRGMGLPGRNHEGAVFPSPHLTNRTRCSCWPWSPSSCTARLSALLTGGCCAATAFYFLHIVCVSCFTPPFLEITPSGCGPWARGSPEGAASGWLLSGRLLCNQWIRSPLPGGVFYSSLPFLLSVVVFLLAPQRRSHPDGAVTISGSATPAGCEVVHPPSATH